MACCAVNGSYTPGAKTNGWVSSNVLRRMLGCTQREVGTVKPGGSSGVERKSSLTWPLRYIPTGSQRSKYQRQDLAAIRPIRRAYNQGESDRRRPLAIDSSAAASTS